jgi:TPP-dependent indolepyruvate ferredoxin oxidoreductase alpha subunit
MLSQHKMPTARPATACTGCPHRATNAGTQWMLLYIREDTNTSNALSTTT